MAERISAPDSSSDISVQQSVGLSPGKQFGPMCCTICKRPSVHVVIKKKRGPPLV